MPSQDRNYNRLQNSRCKHVSQDEAKLITPVREGMGLEIQVAMDPMVEVLGDLSLYKRLGFQTSTEVYMCK